MHCYQLSTCKTVIKFMPPFFQGFSGLHHAVKRQDEEMVSLFLEQKGILTYDTLFHAILEENIPITKLLLEHQDRISPQLMGSSIRRIVPTTLPLPGLPRVLSPTKITTRQSLTDLEEFDSEFPIYFTPLLIAAILGNTTLIEMFYDRGERLESELYNHNTGCACRICGKYGFIFKEHFIQGECEWKIIGISQISRFC